MLEQWELELIRREFSEYLENQQLIRLCEISITEAEKCENTGNLNNLRQKLKSLQK